MSDDEDEKLLADICARKKEMVSGHLFPIVIQATSEDDLRSFLREVTTLAIGSRVQVNPINTDNDEDQRTLMRLIGANSFAGMFRA